MYTKIQNGTYDPKILLRCE